MDVLARNCSHLGKRLSNLSVWLRPVQRHSEKWVDCPFSREAAGQLSLLGVWWKGRPGCFSSVTSGSPFKREKGTNLWKVPWLLLNKWLRLSCAWKLGWDGSFSCRSSESATLGSIVISPSCQSKRPQEPPWPLSRCTRALLVKTRC